jgi:hypothetical protein
MFDINIRSCAFNIDKGAHKYPANKIILLSLTACNKELLDKK